jgi:CYTH domain-containing protein
MSIPNDPEALPLEIERKYLLGALPEAARDAPAVEIVQGWLPGERIVERLRRVRALPPGGGAAGEQERWYRTIKAGHGLVRMELEEEAPAWLGEALWPLTEGRRVAKRRYCVPEGERVWEIDEFTDRTLFLAEIELPSEDARVDIPSWLEPYLACEVTGEREYTNRFLAR